MKSVVPKFSIKVVTTIILLMGYIMFYFSSCAPAEVNRTQIAPLVSTWSDESNGVICYFFVGNNPHGVSCVKAK